MPATPTKRKLSPSQKIAREARRIVRQISGLASFARLLTPPLPRIAIMSTGGIGDHIIAARFLRDLIAAAGPFRFDVYCNGKAVGDWVFGSLDGLVAVHGLDTAPPGWKHRYPLCLHVSNALRLISVRPEGLRGLGRPGLERVVEAITEKTGPFLDLVNAHYPHLDSHLARFAGFVDRDRYGVCHWMADVPSGGLRLDLPVDALPAAVAALGARPWITVHNGYDTDGHIEGELCTKVYPHFERLVDALHRRFPGFTVVQVGTVTSTPIAGVDIDLLDATTLPELAAVIRGSALHIDGESGVVHIAACLGVRSCVVFGPTSWSYFGYRDNINLAPLACGDCWWTEWDWRQRCIRGDAVPRCVASTSPERIVEAIAAHLDATAAG
jgi:hypothetical protein